MDAIAGELHGGRCVQAHRLENCACLLRSGHSVWQEALTAYLLHDTLDFSERVWALHFRRYLHATASFPSIIMTPIDQHSPPTAYIPLLWKPKIVQLSHSTNDSETHQAAKYKSSPSMGKQGKPFCFWASENGIGKVLATGLDWVGPNWARKHAYYIMIYESTTTTMTKNGKRL